LAKKRKKGVPAKAQKRRKRNRLNHASMYLFKHNIYKFPGYDSGPHPGDQPPVFDDLAAVTSLTLALALAKKRPKEKEQ